MNETSTLHTKFGTANIDENGYYRITSRKEGNRNKRLHRLIWEAYNGELSEDMVIHHIDGNKTNNRIDNLKVLSNYDHALLHNKSRVGWKHSEESKKKMSDANTRENNPQWKSYARITKNGIHRGKQRYVIRVDGKKIKQSVDITKLVKWFEETYPDTNLIIEGGVVSE